LNAGNVFLQATATGESKTTSDSSQGTHQTSVVARAYKDGLDNAGQTERFVQINFKHTSGGVTTTPASFNIPDGNIGSAQHIYSGVSPFDTLEIQIRETGLK
jgi:hypothetical protein